MSYFANIQTPSEFPLTIKINNRRNVVMERAPVNILPDLFEFYNKFAFTTNGIGTDDYSDLDDFVSKAANRYTFYMRESETDRIILFLQVLYNLSHVNIKKSNLFKSDGQYRIISF